MKVIVGNAKGICGLEECRRVYECVCERENMCE